MSHPILQLWGGIFYLLQKVFLSVAERAEQKNPAHTSWRTWSWIVYLVGLPPWVALFVVRHNWIAAALEAGGAPAMVLGLIIALRGKGKAPKWLDYIAVVAIGIGLGYSIYDFHGIITLNQWLELGIVTGFLIGTYELAKRRAAGYLWYILMCGSNTALMWIENYPWLVLQQILSLVFIFDAYFAQRRKGLLSLEEELQVTDLLLEYQGWHSGHGGRHPDKILALPLTLPQRRLLLARMDDLNVIHGVIDEPGPG